MVFSSIIFLFLFLPVVMALYYLIVVPVILGRKKLGIRLGNGLLLLSSLFFYSWGEQWLVFVMITSTMIDYTSGLIISGGWRLKNGEIPALEKGGQRTRVQKTAMVVSIGTNLSILGVFKYFNFGIDNVNALADFIGLDWLVWKDVFQITLPLGISFYTFQSMSYTIDVYRGETRATRNLLDFSCFVTMFPQLVAGPIVRYRDIATQLVDRVVTRECFASGINRFIIGLGKKVLVANTVAKAGDGIMAIPNDQLTTGLAWLGLICFHIQVYFDFSGYSDMAIGLGRMFGFKFLENFNYPYISKSIREFWQRWHISLSHWFRDYLFIPLGGSRGSPGRTYFNLVVVFFLCGLWHGAEWNFVVFGLYQGLFIVLERMGLEKWMERRFTPLRHLYFIIVLFGSWVIFITGSYSHMMAFFSALVGFAGGTGEIHNISLYLRSDVITALLVGGIFTLPVVPWLIRTFKQYTESREGGLVTLTKIVGYYGGMLVLVLDFFVSILRLSSGTYNPFIYFRF